MERIPDFLSGKSILITGGTGFVTKALVEKLLRSAPGIRKIYLLIRDRKRGSDSILTASDRLQREVFGSSVFDRLRTRSPEAYADCVAKVEAVPFELTRDRLGIEGTTYQQMTENVDIVISVAASVNFEEPLDRALQINALGAQRMVEFARACRDAIYLQVSTAYVGGQQTGRILETPLPADQTIAQVLSGGENGSANRFDIAEEIESVQQLRKNREEAASGAEITAELEALLKRQNRGRRMTELRWTAQLDALRARWVTGHMIREGRVRARRMGWHDSYTLTKAMGEQIVCSTRGNLPVAIVRPSIIESSLEEPQRGWLDGLKVADPLIAHFGKGRLTDFPGNPDAILDLIPVDIVANTIIAALPRIRQSRDVQVYHTATGSENPVTLGEIVELAYDYFRRVPMMDRAGQPIKVERWKFPTLDAFQRAVKLKLSLPLSLAAGFVDRTPFLPWSKRYRRTLSIRRATLDRVLSLSEIYSPYTNLDCTFDTANSRRLYDSLHPADRETYNLDVTRIDWPSYIQDTHIPGLKRFVLKSADGAGDQSPSASRAELDSGD